MAITQDTKRRMLAFKEKLIIADMLKAEAVEGVIECDTITAYTAKMAHAIGRDSTAVNPSTVQSIASELGIILRSRAGQMSLPAALSRIVSLEMQAEKAAKVIADHELRIAELERLFITGDQVIVPESVVNGAVGQDRVNAHRTGKRA